MTINEAKQILKKSGYLVENGNCILNITQDKCVELAPKIQEETNFFDSEGDCLDFLTDCIGYKEIGEVSTEIYNYLSSVYGIDDEDIEADRADIEVLLKCIEDNFCFN